MSAISRPDEPVGRVPSGDVSALEQLRRWEQMGGTWQVVSTTSSTVTVALLRCDGGEEVERLVSADPLVRTFLRDRHDGD